jgi:dTMP kinase
MNTATMGSDGTVQGRFITVEGIEGAGKTSCLGVLETEITRCGHSLVKTREPGGTALGEELRQVLLGHRHDGMADDTELLLMFAARSEHLHAVIEPALGAGSWVLCDRFTDATYAYQGFGRGVAIDRIKVLERWVQGGRRPDLTLLLDVPVTVGLERAGRRSAPDRFERQAMSFFERTREGYLTLARREPSRFAVIDAGQPIECVEAEVRTAIGRYLEGVA